MDSDGRYRGPDNAVHQAKGFTNYSTFSLWDTYRALHPLLTLVQPEQRTNDFVNSLLASRRDSPYGVLPVWSFHGLETWCMIGYHSVPVIADAYMKGIRGYDADEALRRRWSPAPATARTTASRNTCSWAMCRSTRKAKPPPRRWNTPTTTGPSRAWPKRWAATTSRRSSTKRAAQLAPRLRRQDRLHARTQAGRQLPRTVRSRRQRLRHRLHRRQCLAVLVVRAAGCRRPGRRAWRRRQAGRAPGRRVRRQGRSQDLRAHGRHHRPHRLVRARQRAEPPCRLSLCLRRPAVAHAGAPGPDHGDAVRTAAGRPCRQ